MMIKIKGGRKMMTPELVSGAAAVSGGILGVLLFMQTLKNLEKESAKYLLVFEAWSAIVLLLVGFNILPLLSTTIVMISLEALMIAASFVIYDDQKTKYDPTKA